MGGQYGGGHSPPPPNKIGMPDSDFHNQYPSSSPLIIIPELTGLPFSGEHVVGCLQKFQRGTNIFRYTIFFFFFFFFFNFFN